MKGRISVNKDNLNINTFYLSANIHYVKVINVNRLYNNYLSLLYINRVEKK